MNSMKKVTATVLAATMVVATAGICDVENASAAVKVLNGKSKKITVGDTFKIVLKANGAVSYKSSSKKVAKVTKKGVVKGVKPGKATITIKGASGSAKVKVTVNPSKVKAVSAAADVDTVKVTWTKVKKAAGYEVYVSTKAKSGFKKIKTVTSGSKTSVNLTDLKSGTYYFKVKAYAKAGKKKLKSEYSKATEGVKVWTLTWSDEFNGNSLDTNNWTFETGQTGWGNGEWQNYTASGNYEVKDGSLVIIPRINYNKATRKFDAKSATSTRIKTKGKKEFTYGKMEIRAKSSQANGTWSAGWMLGNDLETNIWPKCGEIDIMEGMSGGVPQTIHCEYFNNQPTAPGGNKNYDTGLTQAKAAEDFHTYTALWNETSIEFSVDGKLVGLYDPSKYKEDIRQKCWPFNHDFFFILNCAIGGNASSTPDDKKPYDATGWKVVSQNGDIQTLEDYFYIDYVRVYQ
ncbi:MAG: family 16 glycosylhydrolase [Lachnospiraceae bacterium]|nr:family 16 glycosylhydrolase [Lachnospiraceae bacterium]